MRRLVTAHCFILALAACGEPRSSVTPPGSDTDAGSRPDGSIVDDGGPPSDGGVLPTDGGGIPPRFLARVGPGPLHARPGALVPLKAVLVDPDGVRDTDGGALPQRVAGVNVIWSIGEGDALASLNESTPITDADGLTTATLVANAEAEGTVKVRAEVPTAGSHAEWTITLEKPTRHVQIVPSPPTIALTDTSTATSAAVIVRVAQTVTLDVRAVEGSVEGIVPLEGVNVQFVFVTSIAGASFSGMSTRATDHNGRTSVQLVGGTTVGTYKVMAIIDGNIGATFNVSVTNTSPSSCTVSAQCGNNSICVEGACRGASSGCGSSDALCPVGFKCSSGSCQPVGRPPCAAVPCPNGFQCNASQVCALEDPQCTTTPNCPMNSTCADGICFWTGGLMLNVTGHWFTAHDFDIHTALPGWLQLSGDMASGLDDLLAGRIDGLPHAVNVLLQGLATAYLPAWAREMIFFLKNLPDAFAHLRVLGEMDVLNIDSAGKLWMTEQWKTLRFQSAAFCPPGTVVDATHTPPCSRLDLATSELAQANFAVNVHPVTARLVDNQLLVDRRSVDLRLMGIIAYALSTVTERTGHPSFQGPPGHPEQGALYNLIDCNGIAELVLAAGLGVDVTGLCRSFMGTVTDDIAASFNNIVVTTNALSFVGRATATAHGSNMTTADELGTATFETASAPDGRWSGRLEGLADTIPGRWRAARQPLE